MKRPLMIIGADPEAERIVSLLDAQGYVLISSTPEKVSPHLHVLWRHR